MGCNLSSLRCFNDCKHVNSREASHVTAPRDCVAVPVESCSEMATGNKAIIKLGNCRVEK